MPVIIGLVVACYAIGQQIGQTGVPFNGGFFDTIIFAFVFIFANRKQFVVASETFQDLSK